MTSLTSWMPVLMTFLLLLRKWSIVFPFHPFREVLFPPPDFGGVIYFPVWLHVCCLRIYLELWSSDEGKELMLKQCRILLGFLAKDFLAWVLRHHPEDILNLNACIFADKMAKLLSILFDIMQESSSDHFWSPRLSQDVEAPDSGWCFYSLQASGGLCQPHNLPLALRFLSSIFCREVGHTDRKYQQNSC